MATKSEHNVNANLKTKPLYTEGKSRESLTTTDFSKFWSDDDVISNGQWAMCKMRGYLEEQIYIFVSSFGNAPVICKIRLELNLKGKIRIVHLNILMHCDNVPDNFDWDVREPASQKHPI